DESLGVSASRYVGRGLKDPIISASLDGEPNESLGGTTTSAGGRGIGSRNFRIFSG
ncbi:hypothetical protein HAX54_015550, partial [Datura stramonium]|nr:hypothetical protein [Datura stramonium]